MRKWTRDKQREEGGTHRMYVSDDGWIAERRRADGGGFYWQVARNADSYWENADTRTLAEAKAYVEAQTEKEVIA